MTTPCPRPQCHHGTETVTIRTGTPNEHTCTVLCWQCRGTGYLPTGAGSDTDDDSGHSYADPAADTSSP